MFVLFGNPWKVSNLIAAICLVSALAPAVAPSNAAPLAIYTVTTTADPGPATCTAVTCSLRAAILASNAAGTSTGNTIIFNLTYPVTITLSSPLPAVTGMLVITGPGWAKLAVNGDGNRVFTVNSTGNLTLNGLTISQGNDIFKGGGILVDRGALTISNVLINDNLSSGTGAGLFNDGGVTSISLTTFSSNHSFQDGAIGNTGTMTVTESIFSDNFARTAGGIHNYETGRLTITNSTFAGNDATQSGGGAIINQGSLVIANSTFDNNGALRGADIANGGTVHVTNSTLTNADPRSTNSIDSPSASASLTIRNSILAAGTGIEDCSASAGLLDVDSSNLATDNTCASAIVKTPTELNLGPLKKDLGRTPTIAPLAGSAAIDTGNDLICATAFGAPGYGAGGIDQRGILRPQGTHCDIGAVEYIPFSSIFIPILSH